MLPVWFINDLSFDGVPFTVNNSVWGDDAVGARIGLHHLELHCPHAAPDQEDVICQTHTQTHAATTQGHQV